MPAIYFEASPLTGGKLTGIGRFSARVVARLALSHDLRLFRAGRLLESRVPASSANDASAVAPGLSRPTTPR